MDLPRQGKNSAVVPTESLGILLYCPACRWLGAGQEGKIPPAIFTMPYHQAYTDVPQWQSGVAAYKEDGMFPGGKTEGIWNRNAVNVLNLGG